MIGLVLQDYLGVGDKIQFTHIPENIFKFTGEKVYDISRSWVFDNNPYIERDIVPENLTQTLDLWQISHGFSAQNFKSHAERFFAWYNETFKTNFQNPPLRHPRLYIGEDKEISPNRVIVHTTGKSEVVSISDEVIEAIAKNYKNYDIIQIGGVNDKKTPFISKLGLSYTETAELIATSAIFIGVNSGMMNIANCYPRVNKKILIPRDLDNFLPMSKHSSWFDHGSAFFNYTENDVGATFSYLKI
jgi:hypothetical protein